VRDVYGYNIHRFEAVREVEIVGLLVLTHVKHPIFGNYLTTAPFGSYGGFAYLSLDARDALLKKAQALANELGVEYVNLRFEAGHETPLAGWLQHPIYSTYYAELNPDSEKMLNAYGSDHRNHIRKSLKKNFSIKFGHLDLLNDVYETLARSMHELGSPYHSKNYLRAMAESLDNQLEFAVLYNSHNELAGAGVFITQGNIITNLHANILRDQRSDYAGEFLYWSVIQRYSQKGFQVFDMGRSLNGSGNEVYKMKWRPRKVPLAYWYYLPKGGHIPELNQKSAKFQLAIRVWKLLPAFVVRAVGPHLIRGIV
jgi:FemAB-related protein (PEP-CTERM system-associated)